MRVLPILVLLAAAHTPARSWAAPALEPGFKPIFDGASLAGWETPDSSYWSVEDNAITGKITPEHPCTVNQYLVWTGGEMADFELLLESRLRGAGAINNGFQFRSRLLPDHDMCGYQVDNNLQTPWQVRLYEEFGRHTLAMRGERAQFDSNASRTATQIEDASGDGWFALENWHEYHLTCIGPKVTLHLNGRLAAEFVDNDPQRQAFQGVLGLQLHSGPETAVQFRNIRLKVLKSPSNSANQGSLHQQERQRLLDEAQAWWALETGGHGAKVALRHIPGWEHFELNRRAIGPKAHPGAKIVILDGAYFETGAIHAGNAKEITVFLRGRVPGGRWDSALFGNTTDANRSTFNLFAHSAEGQTISFEVTTEEGSGVASFSIPDIEKSAWHDLVGRYDGSAVSIFCDGQLKCSRRLHGRLLGSENPVRIGAEIRDGKPQALFHGELQDAAIWARKLTDGEIRVLSLLGQ